MTEDSFILVRCTKSDLPKIRKHLHAMEDYKASDIGISARGRVKMYRGQERNDRYVKDLSEIFEEDLSRAKAYFGTPPRETRVRM